MQSEIYTDYAIRILRFLHTHDAEMLTTMQITQAIDITTPVFASIANQLRNSGILRTIQGRHGGYMLGKPANAISIYDVFVSIEGEMRINQCLETYGLCKHGKQVECKIHEKLYSMQDEFVERLSNVFIADLV